MVYIKSEKLVGKPTLMLILLLICFALNAGCTSVKDFSKFVEGVGGVVKEGVASGLEGVASGLEGIASGLKGSSRDLNKDNTDNKNVLEKVADLEKKNTNVLEKVTGLEKDIEILKVILYGVLGILLLHIFIPIIVNRVNNNTPSPERK